MSGSLLYPVAILVNTRPGYSDYNLGQQLKKYLESRGAEVKVIDKKQSNLFGQVVGHHLISFYTDMVWPYYKYARHVRPKTILHIQCIGPKVYPYHEYVCYLSTLVKPKMSGIPVYHFNVSPSTEKEFHEISRKFFSPSVCREIAKQSSTNYYGLEDGFKIHADANPDSLVVPYNRWEPGQKNLPLHMQLSLVYRTYCENHGRPFEQVFYINEDDRKRKEKEIPDHAGQVYDFRDQFYDRQEFYENIGRHGIFLSTSVRESFGLYYLELLLAGVVGVFQRYPWIEGLLPEYPYMGSENELVPMLAWVRDNYAEARARVINEIAPIIRERYSQQTYLSRIYDKLLELETIEQGKL